MKGKIRPISRQRNCPACNEAFDYTSDMGYFCTNCLDEFGGYIKPDRFFIDLWHEGKRIFICSDKTGQPLDTYERAVRLQSHIDVEIENHAFDPSKYTKAEQKEFYATTVLDRFLSSKIKDIAPSYQRGYNQYVNIAKDFFKTADVRDLRKKDIVGYKEFLENKGTLSAKTIKNMLDLFKTFLRYCKSELEMIDVIPSFPKIDVPEYRFKWVSINEQVRLLGFVPEPDKPILAFLMLHGCRPSEARALKCKDVSFAAETITISSTFSNRVLRTKRKGRYSKSVVIPIHPELLDYMYERVRNNLPEAFLFVDGRGEHYSENKLRRIWSHVKKKAGIADLRLYDATRHSFASNLVNSGISLFKVSKLLGHSSVKMTEKYAHADIEGLKADIRKLTLNREQTVNSELKGSIIPIKNKGLQA